MWWPEAREDLQGLVGKDAPVRGQRAQGCIGWKCQSLSRQSGQPAAHTQSSRELTARPALPGSRHQARGLHQEAPSCLCPRGAGPRPALLGGPMAPTTYPSLSHTRQGAPGLQMPSHPHPGLQGKARSGRGARTSSPGGTYPSPCKPISTTPTARLSGGPPNTSPRHPSDLPAHAFHQRAFIRSPPRGRCTAVPGLEQRAGAACPHPGPTPQRRKKTRDKRKKESASCAGRRECLGARGLGAVLKCGPESGKKAKRC